MREQPVETIEYRGFDINIYQDDMAESPREWDNIGRMLCKHRDYGLGDPIEVTGKGRDRRERYPKDADEITELMLAAAVGESKAAQIRQAWEYGSGRSKKFKDFVSAGLYICAKKLPVILPLYLLDHSGLWMKAGSNMDLSCSRHNAFGVDPGSWDTSMVGFIFCTWEDVKREYGKGKKAWEKAEKRLRGEVETYSQYLSGEVYGYRIEPKEGNKIACGDSCWGFYGGEWKENGLLEAAENTIDCAIQEYRQEVVKAWKEKLLTSRFMRECWAY